MPIIQEVVKNDDKNDDYISPMSSSISMDLNFEYIPLEKDEMEDLYDNVVEKMGDLPEIYKDILFDREILR